MQVAQTRSRSLRIDRTRAMAISVLQLRTVRLNR